MINPDTLEGYRQIGNRFESTVQNKATGIVCITSFDTIEEAHDAFYESMRQRTGKWLPSGIKQTGPHEFQAYAKSKSQTLYLIGTYSTEKEAEHAIYDAMTACWNG